MALHSDTSSRTVDASITIKTDNYGSLTFQFVENGTKVAHFAISAGDAHPLYYTPVSYTSLRNHPLSDLTSDSCSSHEVLSLLTSQQIYLTIVFFAHVYPLHPSLDVYDFKQQLLYPVSTSLLFLLNCICATACKYGSNTKVRFDKTMFYFKALEIHYFNEEETKHPNWQYGHILLKDMNPNLPGAS